MPPLVKRFILPGVLGLFPWFPGFAAEEPRPPLPEFWFAEPAPLLLATSEKAGMAPGGFDPAPERTTLLKGDSVTALVEHVERGKRRQWMVLLAASELSERDRALPPANGLLFYTSTGHEIRYAGSREALAIHVLGPVSITGPAGGAAAGRAPKSPKDIWSGALVNGNFLSLGFSQGCATWLRMREAGDVDGETRFALNAGTEPFPAEVVAAGRAKAARIGLTAADERAMAATMPALLEFFHVAARTPGLSDILVTVVDIPVWSIVARGGRMPALAFDNLPITAPIDPQPWGLPPGTDAYECAFLLRLNQRPALVLRLAVVAPKPPLLASAGVIGLVAAKPDGEGAKLMIRLVAGRTAGQSAAP